MRVPGACWVGRYHKRSGEDRRESAHMARSALDVALKCSAQRREPQGARQGPRDSGRKPRLRLWMDG